jgi:DNA-binding transcriptional LysR family regulator
MKTPLDSRRLQQFSVLAGTGSFTQTARLLHLTQSGISHSMKALEHEAGCRLLDRLGKKVVLTPAGEQLLRHAEKILAEMSAARDALGALGKVAAPRLRLGASATACQWLVPPVVRQFKQQFPDHVLTLEPGDAPALTDALSKNRLDLALTLETGAASRLQFHPLFQDELDFIVSPAHAWAQHRRADRAEIPLQTYLLPRKDGATCRLVQDYFRREQLVLPNIQEVGGIDAARELVKLGLGVSILAPWMVRTDLDAGMLVALPLGRKKLGRTWGILHRPDRQLSPAEETFIALCRAACADLL